MALFSVAALAAAQPFPSEPSPTLSVPLLAGKSTRIGSVKVRVEGADLVVEYALDPAWSLNETHLDVQPDWKLIPQTSSGNPKPGQFAQKGQHPPGTRAATYRRSLAQLSGVRLYVAAHADVVHSSGRVEGAWAEGTRFNSKGSWATWFTYAPAGQIVLDQGENWLLLAFRGTVTDPPPAAAAARAASVDPGQEFSENVYILRGELGINEAPLPPAIQEDLLLNQEPEEQAYFVSQDVAEGIEASEAAGALTPEIAAIAEPLDSSAGVSALGSSCATQVKTIRKVFDLSGRGFGDDFDLGGGFKGSYSVTGNIEGGITGELNLNVRRKKVIAWCVPYAVSFKNVHLFGDARANAGVTLSGTIEYSHSFGPVEVAKPRITEFIIWVGPIPVLIGFNLPISLGMDLEAEVTGSITYNGEQIVTGSFDWVCTLSGCDGGGDYDTDAGTTTQTITGGVSGHIKPKPYADVGVRVYVYDDWFLHAQVGVRPFLLGDLWGFTGNNCGDADGDGTFESVQALTFDLDRRVDLTGQLHFIGEDVLKGTIKEGKASHVGFYDLIGSEAMQPQIHGPGSVRAGTAADYLVKIRPCWPYDKNIFYRLDWGDGSAAQELESSPDAFARASHTWAAAGDKIFTATSARDKHGRALDQSTSRTIQVLACNPPAITAQPQSVTINSGDSATLSVASDGTAFQWYEGNSGDTSKPIPAETGGTGSSLEVMPAATTSYWVRVSKTCLGQTDSTDSSTATVTVNFVCLVDGTPCGGDGNHTCQAGQCVCTNCASGVCCGASGNSYCDGQSYLDPDTGYTGVCASTLSSCSAANDFDGTNSVYHDGEIRGCVKHDGNYEWYPRRPSPRCQEVSPVCGFLCSTHYNNGSGFMCDQDGVWNQSPPLSYCYNGTIPDGWSCQTPPVCEAPQITSQPQSVTIQEGQSASLAVVASGTSPTFQWYSGSSGDTSSPVPGGTGTSLLVTPSATQSYWARASNACGQANSQTATVTVSPVCEPPSIASQPQSVTITSGDSATLSVGAAGTSPLSYQWYQGAVGSTFNPIPGGTGPSVTVAPATTTSYWVQISNACGTRDSAGVTVAVEPVCIPPSLQAQPQSVTIDQGDTAVLSVSASGTSLVYQWYQGAASDTSSPVAGGTGDTLFVSPSSTTSYWVQVSNDCGAVDSSTATVTVNAGCGPDGTPCGGDGNHTCQAGQCVCTNCASGACCGASGNSYCDGQQHFDPNTGYTGVCTSTLSSCDASNDFDGDNEVYHDGDILACAKYNGVHQWFPRRPSPRCQEVSPVCGFLCAYNYNNGAGFQCEENGFWSQNPPLPYCYGGTIPDGWACQ